MARYILKYRGSSKVPEKDVEYIKQMPAVKIVDSTGRHFLAEMDDAIASRLKNELENWSIHAQTLIPKPDNKEKIRHLHK